MQVNRKEKTMKINKLKAKIKERGRSQKECADHLGLSLYTFNLKVNGKKRFYCYEAEKLGNFLEMTDFEKVDIFLS